MFGFYNVNKPRGPTSHDIVAGIRRMLPRRTKVGHAGTLDPFAGGVLVIGVGPATRLTTYVQASPKRYRAGLVLGEVSDSHDPEGVITPVEGAKPVSAGVVDRAVRAMVGEIRQVPPSHSAVHVDGRRAYEFARSGRAVKLEARPVTIHAMDVVRYDWPALTLDIRCSSGTYIRSIARDLGDALGVGAYCKALVRTAVGEFTLEDAINLPDLDAEGSLLPPRVAVGHLPEISVDDQQRDRVVHGLAVTSADTASLSGDVVLVSPSGDLLALADARAGKLHPRRVFVSQ